MFIQYNYMHMYNLDQVLSILPALELLPLDSTEFYLSGQVCGIAGWGEATPCEKVPFCISGICQYLSKLSWL